MMIPCINFDLSGVIETSQLPSEREGARPLVPGPEATPLGVSSSEVHIDIQVCKMRGHFYR